MENQNQNQNQFQPQGQSPAPVQKPKKPWYKKWWIWVIIGVAVTGTIGAFMPKNTSSSKVSTSGKIAEATTEKAAVATTEKATEKATEKPTEKATEAPKENRDEYIKSCQTIDYKTLSRNPDKYKGEKFKFTGQVIQVMESDSWFDDSTTLRINVTATENEFAEGGYLWDDTIISTVTIPDGEDRILENDIIDIYGTCAGLYTYESVLGQKISLPRIDIKYYSIHQ